jgi:hypothetical protein
MSGCVKAIIVLFVLFVIAVVAFYIFAGALINNLSRNLGINPNGGGGGTATNNCPFLSNADARTVFGGSADAIELSGFSNMMGIVLDTRVLANAPDCWVTNGEKAYIARLARYQGGDTSAVFAAEKKAAQPTSTDQGNGLTVTTEGYFGGDVSGLGDEAFCTGISSAIMAGVLVHQGDRLVYVSVGPADPNKPPQMGAASDGTIVAPELCTFSQEVARFLLR